MICRYCFLYNIDDWTKEDVLELRKGAVRAGIKEALYIVGMLKTSGYYLDTNYEKGVDAFSWYAIGAENKDMTYVQLAQKCETVIERVAKDGLYQIVPNFTAGMDTRARIQTGASWISGDPQAEEDADKPYANRYALSGTAEEIATHANDVFSWVTQNETLTKANLVLSYAWNEHDEGGWLSPTLRVDEEGNVIYDSEGNPQINNDRLVALKTVIDLYKKSDNEDDSTNKDNTDEDDNTEQEVIAKPLKPAGLVYAGNSNLPHYFAWQKQVDVTYNFYVNGTLVGTGITSSMYQASADLFKTAGNYTIAITAVNTAGESEALSIIYTVEEETSGGGNEETPDEGNEETPGGGNEETLGGENEETSGGGTESPSEESTQVEQNPANDENKGDETQTETPQQEDTEQLQQIKVTEIKINAISKKIAAGKKVQLKAVVSPKEATNKALKWKSSNKKFAVVDEKGNVKVKKAGANKTVTITAMATDGSGIKASYKIKIMPKAVKKIELKAPKAVKAGTKVSIKASVIPSEKVNKDLIYTSSNTRYAIVSKKGVVKTKKSGKGKTVRITAKATDGSGKKKTIRIKLV